MLPLMLVCGGLRCEAAGVVMGVAGAWLGGGGVRSRVCGFMHRDEGAEHRKTGERKTAESTPVWNKCPECYTEDR